LAYYAGWFCCLAGCVGFLDGYLDGLATISGWLPMLSAWRCCLIGCAGWLAMLAALLAMIACWMPGYAGWLTWLSMLA